MRTSFKQIPAAGWQRAAGDIFTVCWKIHADSSGNLVKILLAGYRQQDGTSKAMVED